MNEQDHSEFMSKIGSDSTGRTATPTQKRDTSVEAASELASTSDTVSDSVHAQMWTSNGDMFWPSKETHPTLPPNVYRAAFVQGMGICLFKQNISTDAILRLPDTASDGVMDEIRQFLLLEDNFKKYGFLYKRGILLWGPPGSGKTCTIQLVLELIVKSLNGIALFIDDPDYAGRALQMIRNVEPNRLIVGLMEDFDELVARHGEHGFLSLLDGEAQVNNIVFIATTNYPERLDKRFIERPSRFDTVRKIGMPNTAARRFYLEAKVDNWDAGILQYAVENTENFSIAHLRELIVLHKCFGLEIEASVKRLKASFNQKKTSNASEERGMGFRSRHAVDDQEDDC